MIKTIRKSCNFICRNLFENMRFLLFYVLRYFNNDYLVCRKFLSPENVKDALLSGRSYLRLGDGEIAILNNADISYQKYDRAIKISIMSAVIGYSASSNYLVGIPQKYLSMTNRELRSLGMLRLWLPLKVMVDCFFPDGPSYADAHLFYYKGAFEETVVPAIAGRPVIFLVNARTGERLKDTPPPWLINWRVVVAPERDAFDHIGELRSKLDDSLSEASLRGCPLVIVSCGPAGKVLVGECARKGVQAIDLGAGVDVILGSTGIEHRI